MISVFNEINIVNTENQISNNEFFVYQKYLTRTIYTVFQLHNNLYEFTTREHIHSKGDFVFKNRC